MQEPYCLYDLYCMLVDDTIAVFQERDVAKRYQMSVGLRSITDALAYDPHFLDEVRDVPADLLALRTQLRRVKPYILEHPVVELGLQMAEKAAVSPIPYEPFPGIPFWMEFDHASLGDEHERFVAILVLPEPGVAETLRVMLITSDLQGSKELFINRRTGAWEFEQMGTCETDACELAHYTKEGVLYRLTQEDSATWQGRGCTCAQAGYSLVQLLRSYTHLLKHRKRPMIENIQTREVALPYTNPRTRREKTANAEAHRKNKSNIVTISLSAPVRVQPIRSKSNGGVSSEVEMDEEISVEGYWKVLVPSEGKPWKSLHLVPVESYTRRGRIAQNQTYYRVKE